jgi:molybdopterin-guanine dinucleotide biosynthesis protein A
MIQPVPTLGIILAGGLARRMGGADKPLVQVQGQSMVARVVAKLRPQTAACVLNANGDPDRFAGVGLPVIADDLPGFPGPLAGVLAALDWCAMHRPDLSWAVSVAADQPFLPDDLVGRLHACRIRSGAALVQAGSGGRTHPVNALWPVDVRAELRQALVHDDMRKMGRIMERFGAATEWWDATAIDPFFNVNRPEDVAFAETLAGR